MFNVTIESGMVMCVTKAKDFVDKKTGEITKRDFSLVTINQGRKDNIDIKVMHDETKDLKLQEKSKPIKAVVIPYKDDYGNSKVSIKSEKLYARDNA